MAEIATFPDTEPYGPRFHPIVTPHIGPSWLLHAIPVAAIQHDLLPNRILNGINRLATDRNYRSAVFHKPDAPNEAIARADTLAKTPEIVTTAWAIAESFGIESDHIVLLSGRDEGTVSIRNADPQSELTILPLTGLFLYRLRSPERRILNERVGKVSPNDALTIAPGVKRRGVLLGSRALILYKGIEGKSNEQEQGNIVPMTIGDPEPHTQSGNGNTGLMLRIA